jgi:CRISPR-associated exonuclease Cas4
MDTDDYLPISGLQHLMVCERQAALIHIERVWVEDVATAMGRAVHERADAPGIEYRADVRSVRGVQLVSHVHGLQGRADVVEFRAATKAIIPVEYKRGASRFPLADAVQVCAQALCLEEMHGAAITEGALFHAKTRKRKTISLTEELRNTTLRAVLRLHEIFDRREVPPPVLKAVCARCSLEPVCQPRALREHTRGSAYLSSLLNEEVLR